MSCYFSYFGLFLVAGLGFDFWLVIWGRFEMGGKPNLHRCMSIRQRISPPHIQRTPETDTHGTGVVSAKFVNSSDKNGGETKSVETKLFLVSTDFVTNNLVSTDFVNWSPPILSVLVTKTVETKTFWSPPIL